MSVVLEHHEHFAEYFFAVSADVCFATSCDLCRKLSKAVFKKQKKEMYEIHIYPVTGKSYV